MGTETSETPGAAEFTESALWKKIYEFEFGTYGGDPFGALVDDYEFDKGPHDVALLTSVSEFERHGVIEVHPGERASLGCTRVEHHDVARLALLVVDEREDPAVRLRAPARTRREDGLGHVVSARRDPGRDRGRLQIAANDRPRASLRGRGPHVTARGNSQVVSSTRSVRSSPARRHLGDPAVAQLHLNAHLVAAHGILDQ